MICEQRKIKALSLYKISQDINTDYSKWELKFHYQFLGFRNEQCKNSYHKMLLFPCLVVTFLKITWRIYNNLKTFKRFKILFEVGVFIYAFAYLCLKHERERERKSEADTSCKPQELRWPG